MKQLHKQSSIRRDEEHPTSQKYPYSPKTLKPRSINYLFREQRLLFILVGVLIGSSLLSLASEPPTHLQPITPPSLDPTRNATSTPPYIRGDLPRPLPRWLDAYRWRFGAGGFGLLSLVVLDLLGAIWWISLSIVVTRLLSLTISSLGGRTIWCTNYLIQGLSSSATMWLSQFSWRWIRSITWLAQLLRFIKSTTPSRQSRQM